MFCNGSGSTLAGSALLIAPFTERFDVVAHDQRGLGRTEIPSAPYTMAEYAEDAIELVDHMGWGRFRAVGISFGGMVAQELAATWPERVERLALLCTSPGGAGRGSYPLHELAKLTEAERTAVGTQLLDTRFTPEWLAEHPNDQALVDLLAARTFGEKSSEQLRGEQGQIEARSHHDVYDRLPQITCPTLVAAGRYDGIAPLEQQRVHRRADPRKRPTDLRRRPRVHRAGSRRVPRDPRLPRRAVDRDIAAVAMDVWHALGTRLEITDLRPEVGDWVEVAHFDARGGRDYVMVANRKDLTYYRLEPAEAALLPLMDGTRTVGELCVERLHDSGELDVTGVAELVRLLHAGGLLTDAYVDVDAGLERALAATGPRGRWARFARTLTIEWSGAERLTLWLHRHGLRFLFTRVGMVAAALIALGGLVAFGAVLGGNQFEFTPQSVGIGFVILFALNLVLIFIHELGHAALLVHYGRRVKGSGFRIYFGSPAFFIDSSDVLMLGRRQRIAQSFAGPYFEMVATGAAALALWAWPDGGVADVLYRFVVLNYFVLVLNLVPLLELDGYWILSDWLRIPDLRPRSLEFMRHDVWAKLRARDRFSASDIGLGLYSTVGLAFTIFCLWSAVFFWRRTFGGAVERMWDAGPAGIVLLLVLVAFLAGPLLRASFELVRGAVRALRSLWRKVRFRSQLHWRIEAAELLDALPIFDDLPVEILNDLAGRVTLRTVAAQAAVVRQGERADAAYVIRSGRCEVIETDPESGNERMLQVIEAGGSFGELGLVTGGSRRATVRAVVRTELFVIDKPTFDRLLADRVQLPDLTPTVQLLTELRALPPFAHLTLDRLDALGAHGNWRSVAPNEALITQGEPGDTFYVIGAGRFEVTINAAVAETLGPGRHFGEIALLADVPRTATVRAITPARVYRLDRVGFEQLVADAFRSGGVEPASPVSFRRE